MTSTKKNQAKIVDVLPSGRILKKDGDYTLLETGRDKGEWFRLSPPPDAESVPSTEILPKEFEILRQVGDMVQVKIRTNDAGWYRFVQPLDLSKAKTYYQVMKVQHAALITNPDAVLVRYTRDRSMEWVRNVRVYTAPAGAVKPKPKKYVRASGRMMSPAWCEKPSQADTERIAQIAFGKEMANAV